MVVLTNFSFLMSLQVVCILFYFFSKHFMRSFILYEKAISIKIIIIIIVIIIKAAPAIFILWSVEYLLKWNFVQERTFFFKALSLSDRLSYFNISGKCKMRSFISSYATDRLSLIRLAWD